MLLLSVSPLCDTVIDLLHPFVRVKLHQTMESLLKLFGNLNRFFINGCRLLAAGLPLILSLRPTHLDVNYCVGKSGLGLVGFKV